MSSAEIKPEFIQRSLVDRIENVGNHFLNSQITLSTAHKLQDLAKIYLETDQLPVRWLILASIFGELPTASLIEKFELESLSLKSEDQFIQLFIKNFISSTTESSLIENSKILMNRKLVILDFVPRSTLHTGVQRVTRSLCQYLSKLDPSIQFLATTNDGSGLTELSSTQRRNLLDEKTYTGGDSKVLHGDPTHLIFPQNCQILLPEVILNPETASRIRSLAKYSGNEVSFVGYDLIPILGSEYVLPRESEGFTHYLQAVSEADKVLCISDETLLEFDGYLNSRQTISARKTKLINIPLPGPALHENLERHQKFEVSSLELLSVGTIEPRKSQLELLLAVRELLADGLKIRLTFVGRVTPQLTKAFELVKSSCPSGSIVHYTDLSDEELGRLYEQSDLTIFASQYEGFGLPVLESIAHGTPVLTSCYGPVWHQAKDRGGIGLVEISHESIKAELKSLIDEPSKLEILKRQTQGIKFKTFEEYAMEVHGEIWGGHAE